MPRPWYVVLVAFLFVAAYIVKRFVLAPETHPWQIWIPAAIAVAAIIDGIAMEDWGFAGVFGVVLAIEIWRTLPVHRVLSARQTLRP